MHEDASLDPAAHPLPKSGVDGAFSQYNVTMDFASLVGQYGLIAVFAGTVLEGESVLLAAGYAAHRGYLDFPLVVAVAWLGAVTGDQAWFWLGRRHGAWLMANRPGLATRIEGALGLIERNPGKIVLAMRFIWGLRTALPIAIGMSNLSSGRFLVTNALSAALWAPLVAGLGWLFGGVITRHASQLHQYEHWLAGGLVVAGLVARGFYRRRWARRTNHVAFFHAPNLHPLARMRAWHRFLVSLLAGLAAADAMSQTVWEARLVAGWLSGALTYLVIVWWGMGHLDATETRRRASSLDPGNVILYVLIVIASWVSLVGVLLVTDTARSLAGTARWGHIGLALASLATTWSVIQTVFALRYARRYYGADAGGLEFPGGRAPDYMDFAYFSAVIGMTSQVADVAIASPGMRRMVLLHGLVAFGFNLLVLALTLNLVASALG